MARLALSGGDVRVEVLLRTRQETLAVEEEARLVALGAVVMFGSSAAQTVAEALSAVPLSDVEVVVVNRAGNNTGSEEHVQSGGARQAVVQGVEGAVSTSRVTLEARHVRLVGVVVRRTGRHTQRRVGVRVVRGDALHTAGSQS